MRINILSHPRSGSTYLYNCFSKAFPDHKAYLEPVRMNTEKWFNNVSNSSIRSDQEIDWDSDNIITKNHSHHPIPPGNWFTIKIIRKDLFESSLSLALGLTNNKFLIADETPYVIDKNLFKECLDFLYKEHKRLADIKSDKCIFYEDLTFDPMTDLNNLGFYTTHNITPISKMVDKKKTVQNYNELREIYEKINIPSVYR